MPTGPRRAAAAIFAVAYGLLAVSFVRGLTVDEVRFAPPPLTPTFRRPRAALPLRRHPPPLPHPCVGCRAPTRLRCYSRSTSTHVEVARLRIERLAYRVSGVRLYLLRARRPLHGVLSVGLREKLVLLFCSLCFLVSETRFQTPRLSYWIRIRPLATLCAMVETLCSPAQASSFPCARQI